MSKPDEKDAVIAELQAQLIAMDRILSGRTLVANSLAAESGLLLAPFLHIQGVFDNGNPGFHPTEIAFRLETSFISVQGRTWIQNYDSRESSGRSRSIRGLTNESRVIVAIVNPQK